MAQTMPARSLGAELVSRNPATGEEIGRAPQTMPEEVAQAVGRAREAQREWSKLPIRERGRLIMKARKIILQEMEEIALLISQETGKPVAEVAQAVLPQSVATVVVPAVRTASTFVFPIGLAVAVVAFLALQARIDSGDPKLSAAPLAHDDDVVTFT